MDWKKAKTILILVFVALNLILAIILFRSIKGGEISKDTINNTLKILEQNNILIECPIPKYTGKDYILQNEETVLDRNTIVTGFFGDNYSKISDNIYKKGTEKLVFSSDCSFEYSCSGTDRKVYTQNKSGVEAFLRDLLKKLEIPFDEFQLDSFSTSVSGESSKATYKGIYGGYSVFDNYIEVEIGKIGIKSIRYQYKKPLTISDRDINVIPVYQILTTKITNYPGIDISDVAIGFKGIKVDKDTKTLYEGLSWRIRTTEGKEFYFNATSGEIMD